MLLLVGCSGHTTQPSSSQFGVYVSIEQSGTIYVADLDSLHAVDSLPGVGIARIMTTTADQKHLLVSGDHPEFGRSLVKYSIETGQVTAHKPASNYFWIDPILGGEFVLTYLDSLQVVNPVTLEPVIGIPSDYRVDGNLDADSEIAVAVGDTFRILNVFTGKLRGGYQPRLSDGTLLSPSPYPTIYHAPSHRLTMLHPGYFLIGDLQSGETILQYRIVSPFGDIAFSNDRQTLAVSDPGGHGFMTPLTLDLFDFSTLTHTARLTTITSPGLETVERLRFLPGDQYLLGIPPRNPAGGPFQLIDLASRQVLLTRRIPPQVWFVAGVTLAPRRSAFVGRE